MKLSQAKDYLPFVQAAAEGKTIQCFEDQIWKTLHPDIDTIEIHRPNALRIKPGAKLRPWTPEEVPVGALLRWKDTPLTSVILGIRNSHLVGCNDTYPLALVLTTMLHSTDGGKTWQPCGVMEENP